MISLPKPREPPAISDEERERAKEAAERKRARAEAEIATKQARAQAWAEFKGKGSRGDLELAAVRPSSEAGDGAAPADVAIKPSASAGRKLGKDAEVSDREAGRAAQAMSTSAPCYWDEPMHYEVQVDILLTLSRLMESFTAAAMSIQHSRSFDAVCIVVPGAIAAIADAVLRRMATDRPSEVSAVLLGKNKDGRSNGNPGFGLSISTFAEQSETMEVHSPELSVARCAVLDYFMGPAQRRLEPIFDFERKYKLKPSRYLKKVSRGS